MSEAVKKVLGDEMYNQVMEKFGEGQDLMLNDGSYIPKSRLSEVIEAKRAMEAEITTLKASQSETQKVIDRLTTDAESSTKVKGEFETLKQALAQVKEDSNKVIAELQKDHKFDLAVNALIPKNLKAVKALFELDKISVDGDNLLGFKEQAEVIKKENPFLFDGEQKTHFEGGDDSKGKKKDMQEKNPWADGSTNLFEQVMLRKSNPELANKLKAEAERKRQEAKLKR